MQTDLLQTMLTSFVDSRPSSSSPTSSESSTDSSSESCAVCGDTVNGKRYGAPACLGCIVFFRRAVINQNHYKCWKKGNCLITFASRCVCRCCRLRKCYSVGMKAEAIQRRDLLGPRKPKSFLMTQQPIEIPAVNFSDSNDNNSRCSSSGSDSDIEIPRSIVFEIDSLLQIQRCQRAQHEGYSGLPTDSSGCVQVKKFGKFHRRARAADINFILKLGLENANEWAMQFDAYQNLGNADRNLVLSEFGFAYLLIDQGYKTANEAENGFWLLQNGSFMHPNYFLALPVEDAKLENAEKKAELHFGFVNELVKCVSAPFRQLEIDEFECAILKTVLLLTPSFPGKVVYQDVDSLHSKCMTELMDHCALKFPDRGPERFGEIILLISSIRCAIKAIYNQTRVSDIFHLMEFDPFVRNIFLS